MAKRVEQVPLNFENLADLDAGRIGKLLQKHIKRAAADCIDRPGDKKARKVTLQFTMKPVMNSDGDADTAHVEIQCKSDVPTNVSMTFPMLLSGKDGLLFNKDFPEELHQPALPGTRSSDLD